MATGMSHGEERLPSACRTWAVSAGPSLVPAVVYAYGRVPRVPLTASRMWTVHSHSSAVSRPLLVSGLGGRGPFASAHSGLAHTGRTTW